MKFNRDTAEVFVPDGLTAEAALAHTTHLAIAAHQDDIEIMAFDGILACFQREDRGFTGVTVTNGSGSPRDDLYKAYTDEAMRAVRRKEQRKAAVVGEYVAQVMLDYASAEVKDPTNAAPWGDLVRLLEITKPDVVYTHNLADKHPTHVAVVLRVIEALRSLPTDGHPFHVYGCEVWRDLDWLPDEDKIAFDCSAHENLQMALLGVFDSQICGGKRYDLATMGRRRANATYYASHDTDIATGMIFAMDLMPLIQNPTLNIATYACEFVERFADQVTMQLTSFQGRWDL